MTVNIYGANDELVHKFIGRVQSLPPEDWLSVFQWDHERGDDAATTSGPIGNGMIEEVVGTRAWDAAQAMSSKAARWAVEAVKRGRSGPTGLGAAFVYERMGGDDEGEWAERAVLGAIGALAASDDLRKEEFEALYEPFAGSIPLGKLRRERSRKGRARGMLKRLSLR